MNPRRRWKLFLATIALLTAGCRVKDAGGEDSSAGCEGLVAFADGDGDGIGAGEAIEVCEAPAGTVAEDGDCDDADPAVYPGAEERCNGLDDDCDGVADLGEEATWYADRDGDGFGDPAAAELSCVAQEGLVSDGTDCDDGDATVYPGAEEICGDDDDDDCDGEADAGEVGLWHSDDDGDGYGHPGVSEETCDPAEGWVDNGTDCRPSDADAHPGAEEVCNDVDDDCDGEIDEDMDQDGDGHRSDACEDGDDCDDTDPDAYPGNPAEVCDDGVDSDCDGFDYPCGFAGDVLLSDADVHLWSTKTSYYAGLLIRTGDATGDGVDDVLASTLFAESYGGGGFLIPGGTTGSGALQDEAYRISGRYPTTYGAGRSLGIGDVDGDGVGDLGFGAPYGANAGMYLEYGPITGDRDLVSWDTWLSCTSGYYCGHGGDLGDLDSDGVADAVVGAYYSATGGFASGSVYTVLGPITGDLDLEAEGVEIVGESVSSYTGRHLRVHGDVNGDGVGDLLVAAPYASGAAGLYSGIVYVVHGPATITSMADADARLLGAGPIGYLGEYASMDAEDVDGDGYAEVVVGSLTSRSGSYSGAAWMRWGPVTGDIDMVDYDVEVTGAGANDGAGTGVALGDVNGDGLYELLIGAPGESTERRSAGAGFLFLAPASGSYSTSDADVAMFGTTLSAAAGTGVVFADVTGDGDDDVILGAPSDATGASGGGGVYILFAD